MKKIKIGINGFGRIGRQLTKLILDNNNLEIVAINDLSDSKTSAHLFKFDTIFIYMEKLMFPGRIRGDMTSPKIKSTN